MPIVSFRKSLLILLFTWTFLFFLFIGIVSNPFDGIITGGHTNNCGVRGDVVEKKPPFPKELSFIVLNWKRLDCIKTIIHHAQVYNSFITEIVVGNNNPNISLRPSDFFSPSIPVRVLNFPQNRYFYARYEACLLAEGLYCYLQDDDWDNKHLRSLYANFLRYPHLLHTDTNAFVHYLSWAWTFFDPDINLHTGFSWVGTGAITSKVNVKRFLEEQAILINRDDLSLADMYFATWFNQVPYQLENELSELESRFGFSSEPGGILRNKLHITKGVQVIYEELSNNSTYFPLRELHPTVEERYTKAPCHADDCLFMTSLHAFPNPKRFIYSAKYDLEAVESVHKTAFSHQQFVSNAYHHAVDESLDTSWISSPDIQPRDFFGIDLLMPSEKEYVYLKVGHAYQTQFSVDVSQDGEKWDNTTCIWEVATKSVGHVNYHRYYLTSGCVCAFRFIRFRSMESYINKPLEVFDITFEDRQSLWEAGDIILTVDNSCTKGKQVIPIEEISPAKTNFLREIGNGEIPVTLILLNWKRPQNFPDIFRHLSKYSFINEYIVWNNNNQMLLEQSQIFPEGVPPNVTLRIVNSPQNLHDYAKYLSCSMATNEHCYFQDDDWQNVHLRSQYSNFLRFPHLFHSMTIPIIYLEHRRWNIYDDKVGLHAGFSWLGVGSFTTKERVKRFLLQLSKFNLNQEELLQADIFFSYFNNDYPVELSATASALDQSNAWSTSVDQWGIVYRRLQLSSSRVYNYLKAGNAEGLITTNKPLPSYEERDVRSPCHNDGCLFITNAYPFPYPDKVVFDSSRTIKEQEGAYNALDWPSNWFWNDNSFDRAVDGNPFTCWSSYQASKQGDYFGLDLLQNKLHDKFTVVLDHDISKYSVAVSSSASCCSWKHVKYQTEQAWTLAGPLRTYTILLDYNHPYRFINFFLLESAEEIMSVYEITEGEFPGKIVSFSENKVQNPSFEDAISFASEPEPNMWYVQHPVQIDFESLQQENSVAATGSRSLVFSSKGGASLYEARQAIDLQQSTPRAVVVTAMSKAENVINMEYPGAGYSITLDITFTDGNTDHNAYTSIFNPGSHSWQAKTIAVRSEKSIKTVTIHLMFRNHKGTVYFDDISLHEQLA